MAGVIGFSDIVGFTEFTAEHGDERAMAVLDEHLRLTECHLEDGDRIVKELGDGLLIWFADATSAVTKVVLLQEELTQAATDKGSPLWVRIGLHFGEPTPRGDDIIGHDVNLASRVSDQAGPGEVVVTEELLVAAGEVPGVEAAPLGPINMKGIPDPVWLYKIDACCIAEI